uniref:N-acetyltransferase domain-containing protein n=1 Tax=Rhabditophanes sp. KR3021 TaxID=114890 RepID=A0AC35U8Q3_9BILA
MDDFVWEPVTRANLSHLKNVNATLFPVQYSRSFYDDILTPDRKNFNRLIYDRKTKKAIGAVCCKILLPRDLADFDDVKMRILTLGCLESYRRKKLGSMMMEFVYRLCAEFPFVTSICLRTQVCNTAAVKFYLKHGFEIAETTEFYYDSLDDKAAHLFVKRL